MLGKHTYAEVRFAKRGFRVWARSCHGEWEQGLSMQRHGTPPSGRRAYSSATAWCVSASTACGGGSRYETFSFSILRALTSSSSSSRREMVMREGRVAMTFWKVLRVSAILEAYSLYTTWPSWKLRK